MPIPGEPFKPWSEGRREGIATFRRIFETAFVCPRCSAIVHSPSDHWDWHEEKASEREAIWEWLPSSE